MTLEAKLKEIQDRLAPEHFPSEAAVSQGIVLPILRELNWDTDNPMVVRPEYTAGRGRVDFALCEGSGSPKVFIEVKGLGGETEDAVEQVMQYAFRAGVRIVVLTDGGTWSVYLPAEEGSYEERRVFKLDLSEHSPQESSKFLQRYLEESRVVSGEALKSALRDLGDRKRLEKARRAVPSAWRDIFEASEPDESLNLLVDVLADRVESKVGVRPDDNDVVNFLHSLQRQEGQVLAPPLSGVSERKQFVPHRAKQVSAPPPSGTSERKQPVPRRVRQVSTPPSLGTNGGGRSGELVILGKSFPCKNPTDAMVIVFKELERRERGFWQRFYTDRRNHGRTRRIIAQGAMRLYDSDNPRYAKAYKQLGGGWVIATYNNKKTIEKNIRIAAEVARLRFGKDIIVNFADSLQSQEEQGSPLPLSGASKRKQPVQRRVRRVSAPGPARVKVVIDGKPSSWQNQSDAMATVFKELQKRDQNFYQRFYEQPRNHGKTRRIIAQDARGLYDRDNPRYEKAIRPLSGGWFISTNYGWEVAGSKSSKKEIIQLAADVAGLKFKENISGKDIIVNLDDD